MREIKRIDRISEKIRVLWHNHPDLRLGQLLESFVFGHHTERNGCIFGFEDDEIEKALDAIEGE